MLLLYGDAAAERALRRLFRDAKPQPSVKGGSLPSDGPQVDPNSFAWVLVPSLIACWHAYRLSAKAEAELTGVPKHALSRLPKRIGYLADEIERVNMSVFGSPARNLETYATTSSIEFHALFSHGYRDTARHGQRRHGLRTFIATTGQNGENVTKEVTFDEKTETLVGGRVVKLDRDG